MWDRSKQKYWISRSSKLWRVMDMDNHFICYFPNGWYEIEAVCFAENDKQAVELTDKAFTECEKIKAEYGL